MPSQLGQRFGVLTHTVNGSNEGCIGLPRSIDGCLKLSSVLVVYGDSMTIDHEGKVPVYLQLAAILREAIGRGDYPPGRRLPSETALMQEHEVARETARKAVRVLADEGLAEVVPGRGVFVTGRNSGAPRQPGS